MLVISLVFRLSVWPVSNLCLSNLLITFHVLVNLLTRRRIPHEKRICQGRGLSFTVYAEAWASSGAFAWKVLKPSVLFLKCFNNHVYLYLFVRLEHFYRRLVCLFRFDGAAVMRNWRTKMTVSACFNFTVSGLICTPLLASNCSSTIINSSSLLPYVVS